MHEASLMSNLLAIVERAAADEGGGPVRVVHMKIGELAGVNADALRFAFDCMSPGTAAERGTLEIEKVPLAILCRVCGATAHPDDLVFVCASCGSSDIEIMSGREMQVDYILMNDEAPAPDGSGPKARRGEV
ncbi:MAG: hydrogenase maturation nickel metallochaperone HypA [Candidatus Krumholzibacteria bacterium]|nr:hydrogenase maturation nickel metallochaperone HypA [Candidatus Krumholzibacteria bacterium]